MDGEVNTVRRQKAGTGAAVGGLADPPTPPTGTRSGHPLELLAFPPDNVPPRWRTAKPHGPCLGVDHSAIVVTNTAQSTDFYQRLGFTVASQSFNQGGEQDRLDGLTGAVVEVTALALPSSAPPHLELLCYRAPPVTGTALSASNDLAATKLVIEVDELGPIGLIRDPTGHALVMRP